ncbi:MAG: hypothetical protein AB7O37_12620 [Vicinamibacteria bacterium]
MTPARCSAPLRLAVALAACGLLAGAGCRRKPQAAEQAPAVDASAPAAPARQPEASAAPRSEPPGTLRRSDVRNAELELNGERLRLRDGIYEDSSRIVRLLEPILRGDLDADGRADAVFVVEDQALGSSERQRYVYAALDREGKPQPTPALPLPDHEKVRNLTLREGEIRIDLVFRRITDKPCCPSGKRTSVIRLGSGQLVEVG